MRNFHVAFHVAFRMIFYRSYQQVQQFQLRKMLEIISYLSDFNICARKCGFAFYLSLFMSIYTALHIVVRDATKFVY